MGIVTILLFTSGCTQQDSVTPANESYIITSDDGTNGQIRLIQTFPTETSVLPDIKTGSIEPIRVMVEVANTEGKPIKDVDVKVSFFESDTNSP